MLPARAKTDSMSKGVFMQLQKRNFAWLLITILVIVLDQLTKRLIISHLTYGQPWQITSFFNLTLTHNPGAAFSLLSEAGGWQKWFFAIIATVVSIYIVYWILWSDNDSKVTKCGLAFILGGAIGNLYDRLHYGYVIDFLQFHIHNWYYPDFNLADSAITLGAVMIVLGLFFGKKS